MIEKPVIDLIRENLQERDIAVGTRHLMIIADNKKSSL